MSVSPRAINGADLVDVVAAGRAAATDSAWKAAIAESIEAGRAASSRVAQAVKQVTSSANPNGRTTIVCPLENADRESNPGLKLFVGAESFRGRVHPFVEGRVTIADGSQTMLIGGLNLTL